MIDESIVLKKAQECASEDQEAFLALVAKGGEVNPAFARAGMERAEWLAFAFVGDRLAGVACLKRPLNSYSHGVFEKAKSRLDAREFNVELGYVSVEPEFQGIGLSSKLTGAILNVSSAKVFATSAAGNARMHATLTRFGFRKVGTGYTSDNDSTKQLCLFVRT